MKRLMFALLACLISAPVAATAQSMHNLQALADAAPNSQVFAGQALWISFNYEGWPDTTLYSSAVRLNKCWGLTAGHVIKDDTGYDKENFKVGNGSNRMNDQGTVIAVAEYHTHPTWDGSWDGNKVDLGVIRFAQPLPGEDLEIGTLSIGNMFEYVGFARPATPATGLLPSDGQRRVFDAEVEGWGGQAGLISQKYARSRFKQGVLPMGGLGTGGGSGSAGVNAAGNIVTVLVYAVGSPNYQGTSYGLRLDLYKDWINSYINNLSCLPPPTRRSLPVSDTSDKQIRSVALD